MRSRSSQSGFTIIEIMIVVVIIGVLATIAVRATNGYVARAKVSEAIIALTNCRTLISEIYMSGDSFPGADNWGCESSGTTKYVGSVKTSDEGIVKVELRGMGDLRLDFHTITLAPLDSTGTLMTALGRVSRWRCGSPVDGTDLNIEFLPGTCRGN